MNYNIIAYAHTVCKLGGRGGVTSERVFSAEALLVQTKTFHVCVLFVLVESDLYIYICIYINTFYGLFYSLSCCCC